MIFSADGNQAYILWKAFWTLLKIDAVRAERVPERIKKNVRSKNHEISLSQVTQKGNGIKENLLEKN